MANNNNLNYESNVEKAKKIIHENPQKALKEIGKLLVKKIKANTPRCNLTRYQISKKKGKLVKIKSGLLKQSIQYWYRKKERDVQIGSKSFYAQFIEKGTSKNSAKPFIMPTITENLETIQEMIKDALKELNKD